MKNMKNFIAIALMLCMVLGLCACGSEEAPATEAPTEAEIIVTEAPTEAPTEEQAVENVDDGLTTYTVTVVDEGGNPIAGAMIQICQDTCYPSVTDAAGTATYRVEEADYKVSFLSVPAGYDYVDDTREFYFESGSTEITIILKAVA